MHEHPAVENRLMMDKESLRMHTDESSQHSPTKLTFLPSCKYLSEPSIRVSERVSLLHKHPRRDSLLTVFYFQTDYHCTFDLSQLAPATTVRKFISIAVEQYCVERWRFTPDGIVAGTYEVKLADLRNQHDPLIDPIDHQQLLSTYSGTCLCLLRVAPKQSNLHLYQKKLSQICDVFEVDVHIQSPNEPHLHMNHIMQLPKGCSIGELKEKLISGCGIIDLAEECVLIEYSKLIRYPSAQSTTKIPERHFELMRIRHRFFLDEPMREDRPTIKLEPLMGIVQESLLLSPSSQRLLYSQVELSNQLALEQPFSIDIDSGMRYFSGRCTLTIDKATLYERTEESTLSKLVGFVWQRKPEQSFPLVALLSVKADRQLLRMVFVNKTDTVCKTYRVKDNLDCRRFVEEVLRRCRLLRKKLTEWEDSD